MQAVPKLPAYMKSVQAASKVTPSRNLYEQCPQEACPSSVQVTQPVQAVSTRSQSKQCPSYPHKKPAVSKLLAQETCPNSVQVTRTRNLSKQCPNYSHKKPVHAVSKLLAKETCPSSVPQEACPNYSHKKPSVYIKTCVQVLQSHVQVYT